MTLPQAEIDARLKALQDKFAAVWATSDPHKLADLYHPEAVMVARGKQAHYGREAIVKVFQEFLAQPSDFSTIVDVNLEAGNGEYLIQRGRFVLSGGAEQFPYEQIFKRQPDDSYLIYHDEFAA